MRELVEFEQELAGSLLEEPILRRAKELGFADVQIALAVGTDADAVKARREELGIKPVYKLVDTCAAEFEAATPYYYSTYEDESEVRETGADKIMILGGGPNRIGQGIEFDYCCVHAAFAAQEMGKEAVMINSNPETVSTDYDECDRLYFEELSLERVLDIYEHEHADGVIVSVGGQIPNNLALPLERNKVRVLGTTPGCIDKAEDRNKFSRILDQIGVDQPEWRELASTADAASFCHRVGYPCLIRPSYVLSGAAMKVVFNDVDLEKFLALACEVSADQPVVISKFVEGAKEIEVDAVAKNGEIVNYAISEHVENAGVHSGDATLILPAQKLFVETVRKVKRIARQVAKELCISGPFNMQFLAKQNDVKVIEANVRASRTFPFVSKTLKTNFIELATKVMVGAHVTPAQISLLDLEYVGIKAPMFSFTRLLGADPVLGVEMASTGEVATFGEDKYEAILTSMVSSGFKVPRRNAFLCIGPLAAKLEFVESAHALAKMGLTLYCSQGTYDFFTQRDVPVQLLHKPLSQKQPNIVDAIAKGEIDMVINIRDSKADEGSISDGYLIRRKAVDFSTTLITDVKLATLVVTALARGKKPTIKAWDQFGMYS
jgi:carbamoyl-phosphate synthase large subunit